MPRVSQGKQPFRIVYYFLCGSCREKIGILLAYKSNCLDDNDRLLEEISQKEYLNKKSIGIVNDLTPVMCKQCVDIVLYGLKNIGAIGKSVTAPNFKKILEWELGLQELYGATAKEMGVAPFTVDFNISRHFNLEWNEENSKTTLWQKTTTKISRFKDLTKFKSYSKKKGVDHLMWLGRVSAVFDPEEKIKNYAIDKKGWEIIKNNIRPYGWSLEELVRR